VRLVKRGLLAQDAREPPQPWWRHYLGTRRAGTIRAARVRNVHQTLEERVSTDLEPAVVSAPGAIDADTHIDENPDTWSYLLESERAFTPYEIKVPTQEHGAWIYDGMHRTKSVRNDQVTHTTAATRELLDIDARLRDMDSMGVDIQIIYPTFFITGITDRPEVELALRRSYNRWLAERCAQSGGRLRWIMVPPLLSMDRAIDEVRWAKDHGACGVLKKGDREAGYWPSESYFFPLYEEAERLDMPISFHVGSGAIEGRGTRGAAYGAATPVVHAFQSLITRDVPSRFPNLRWGFIEANASWVPYVLYNLRHIVDTLKNRPNVSRLSVGGARIDVEGNILARYGMYVSCQVDEDLPYILRHAGEDNLMIGSDYTHNDFSQQIDFATGLQKRADDGEIPQSAVRKIMYDNPRRFYAL
jgi:predicted TIM-barrel fold metal-dependent hydrolase